MTLTPKQLAAMELAKKIKDAPRCYTYHEESLAALAVAQADEIERLKVQTEIHIEILGNCSGALSETMNGAPCDADNAQWIAYHQAENQINRHRGNGTLTIPKTESEDQ